jgi:hypothetical protein
MSQVADVLFAAPRDSGEELRTCLRAGVAVLDLLLPLINAVPNRASMKQRFRAIRERMGMAGAMASRWLGDVLRELAIDLGDAGAPVLALLSVGTAGAKGFDYGYAQLYHCEKKLLLRHRQRQSVCDSLFIHTYLAPCRGCMAFMESFSAAYNVAIVVSHSEPHDDDAVRRASYPVHAPSVCWVATR